MKFNGTIVILAFSLLAFYMQSRSVAVGDGGGGGGGGRGGRGGENG